MPHQLKINDIANFVDKQIQNYNALPEKEKRRMQMDIDASVSNYLLKVENNKRRIEGRELLGYHNSTLDKLI